MHREKGAKQPHNPTRLQHFRRRYKYHVDMRSRYTMGVRRRSLNPAESNVVVHRATVKQQQQQQQQHNENSEPQPSIGRGISAQLARLRSNRRKHRHQHRHHGPNGTTINKKDEIPLELRGFYHSIRTDVFYSLVSMKWSYFLGLIVLIYITVVCYDVPMYPRNAVVLNSRGGWQVAFFAVLFMIDLTECVTLSESFGDAFYFSVHTLST